MIFNLSVIVIYAVVIIVVLVYARISGKDPTSTMITLIGLLLLYFILSLWIFRKF